MARYIDADMAHEMLLRGYVISDVPTADVQEVRHGRWIIEEEVNSFDKWYVCSICRTVVWERFNYCPDCGAKMDEEEQK